MSIQKIKNPDRDIILITHKILMCHNIKLDYDNHCKHSGLIPKHDPWYLSFNGQTAKRAINNDTWWYRFRGYTLENPIFILDDPLELDTQLFVRKFLKSCRYKGLPTFYIIGNQ